MRPLLALALLLVAGCASPQPAPTPTPIPATGPIDLTERLGLFLVDLDARKVDTIAERPGFAWLSPDGTIMTWTDDSFAIVVNRTSNAREIAPQVAWVRVFDNGTGLEALPGTARYRHLITGVETANATLPPAPLQGVPWTGASDDLRVLAGEYPADANAGVGCTNRIFIRATTNERTTGCHMRVSPDGRVAWSEGGAVRVRATDGTITNVTAAGGGDAATFTYVQHENPIFTRDGVLHLRLTGGQRLVLTELVDEKGEVQVKSTGSRRLAVHDARDDGRLLLIRTFDR